MRLLRWNRTPLLRESLIVLRLFRMFFFVFGMRLRLLRQLLVISIGGAARQSALAPGFGGELAVLGKAAPFRGNGFTAFAAGTRGKLWILWVVRVACRRRLSSVETLVM